MNPHDDNMTYIIILRDLDRPITKWEHETAQIKCQCPECSAALGSLPKLMEM